jgi:hypothetical protein
MKASRTAAAQHAGEAEFAQWMLTSGCNPSLQNHYAGQRRESESEQRQATASSKSPACLDSKSVTEKSQGISEASVTASRRVTPEVVKLRKKLNDFSGVDGT